MEDYLDQVFEKVDLAGRNLGGRIYDGCTFRSCILSGANLGGTHFIDCRFEDCDLSNVLTEKTAFQDVCFAGCKMLGIQLDLCQSLGLELQFDACNLKHSSFYGLRIPGTVFRGCELEECDFTAADLSGAVFDECELPGAVFTDCHLEESDFRTARNYLINPETNLLRKARFSLPGALGLLGHLDIVIEA